MLISPPSGVTNEILAGGAEPAFVLALTLKANGVRLDKLSGESGGKTSI